MIYLNQGLDKTAYAAHILEIDSEEALVVLYRDRNDPKHANLIRDLRDHHLGGIDFCVELIHELEEFTGWKARPDMREFIESL